MFVLISGALWRNPAVRLLTVLLGIKDLRQQASRGLIRLAIGPLGRSQAGAPKPDARTRLQCTL